MESSKHELFRFPELEKVSHYSCDTQPIFGLGDELLFPSV
jgi:hypothetical protein